MSVRPLRARVLVKADELASERNGILIPEVARETGQAYGTIVAVSNTRLPKHGELPVKVGDRVIYSRLCGMHLEHDGQKLVILLEDDLMCVVES